MAVQDFLASSYRYFERKGVTTVETILDDVMAECLANVPVWTVNDLRPGTDAILCTSPVDGLGRFFDVLVTNVVGGANLKLEFRVRDQAGVTVCTRRANATASNAWTVRIYTGEYHLYVDIEIGSSAPEAVYGGILDKSPEAQDADTHYVYGGGYRDNADAAANNNTTFAAMIDNVAAALTARSTNWAGASYGVVTLQGARVYRPRELYCVPTGGGTARFAGRCYQVMMPPSDTMSVATEAVIPIDAGVTGTFKTIGGIPTDGTYHRLIAVRIA